MANVIQFPKRKSKEELEQELDDQIIDYSLELSIGVFNKLELLMDDWIMSNQDHLVDESMQKSLVLIHESIKSALCRAHERPDWLHETADALVNLSNTDIKFAYEDELP